MKKGVIIFLIILGIIIIAGGVYAFITSNQLKNAADATTGLQGYQQNLSVALGVNCINFNSVESNSVKWNQDLKSACGNPLAKMRLVSQTTKYGQGMNAVCDSLLSLTGAQIQAQVHTLLTGYCVNH